MENKHQGYKRSFGVPEIYFTREREKYIKFNRLLIGGPMGRPTPVKCAPNFPCVATFPTGGSKLAKYKKVGTIKDGNEVTAIYMFTGLVDTRGYMHRLPR